MTLLHDVVEDTNVRLSEIQTAFGIKISKAVDLLTHKNNVPYMTYIVALSNNPLSKTVKIADLKDNLSPYREYEGRNITKYQEVLEYLITL